MQKISLETQTNRSMPESRTIIVTEPNTKERLDRYLVQRIALSRTQIQRNIKKGLIIVNEQKAIAHQVILPGDRITITEPETEQVDVPDPKLLQETEAYLIIEKPSGLLVHPSPTSQEPTLIQWLLQRWPEIAAVGEQERPGLVHRLDRDVSGLMVIAKTPAAYDHLKLQFRDRQIKKIYTALVIGAPTEDDGDIHFRLARSKRHRGRIAARPLGAEGRDAVTHFSVVRRLRTTTLLAVRILTGRTHQIRAHLFAKGLPIVGDRLYHPKKPMRLPPLERPFLHASQLGFEDIAGSWQEFASPLPEELESFLNALDR